MVPSFTVPSYQVTVTVKEDDNKPPVAVLGLDMLLYVPNTAVNIDGSNSTDDNSKLRAFYQNGNLVLLRRNVQLF